MNRKVPKRVIVLPLFIQSIRQNKNLSSLLLLHKIDFQKKINVAGTLKIKNIERGTEMSNVRERLLVLETDGNLLFHGSLLSLKELIPKQPVNYDRKTGKEMKDGDPCVAATHLAEIAIFRAIVNSRNFPFNGYGSSFRVTPTGNSELTVTRKVWKQLEGKTGYVYVLPRDEFSRHSRMEWRSGHEVKPLEVIAVSAEDLPKNIKVKWWFKRW